MTMFTLQHGETILGTLQTREREYPWTRCNFAATPDFEVFRGLFETELRLLRRPPGRYVDTAAWEQAYAQVDALGLRIVPADGGEVIDDFLLHIDGPEAWLRY